MGRRWESPRKEPVRFPCSSAPGFDRRCAEACPRGRRRPRRRRSSRSAFPRAQVANDLYCEGRKAAGILAEMASDRTAFATCDRRGSQREHGRGRIPRDLRGKATSLRICAGKAFRRVDVLSRLLGAFGARYAEFLGGDFPRSATAGTEDFLRGRGILLRRQGGEGWGTADGLDADGALRFLPDGATEIEPVHSGEILISGDERVGYTRCFW